MSLPDEPTRAELRLLQEAHRGHGFTQLSNSSTDTEAANSLVAGAYGYIIDSIFWITSAGVAMIQIHGRG